MNKKKTPLEFQKRSQRRLRRCSHLPRCQRS